MALLKGKTLNFSNFPTEIKEIIFGYLLGPYTTGDFKNNFNNADYSSIIKRAYSNHVHYSGEFTQTWRVLFDYGLYYNIKADVYDQILMSVCREWYNIIKYLRSKRNLPLQRYTWVGLATTRKEMFEWAVTQDISQKYQFRKEFSLIPSYSIILGDMDTFKTTSDYGYSIGYNTLYNSVIIGNLELIKYVYSKVRRMHVLTCLDTFIHEMITLAIIGGDLDIVKWVIDVSNPKNEFDFHNHLCEAVMYGHLNIVKWLYGFVETVQRYLEHKIYFKNILSNCIRNKHPHIIDWLFTLTNPNMPGIIHYDDWCICIEQSDIKTLQTLISHSEYIPMDNLLSFAKKYNRTDIYYYLKERDLWYV